MVDQKPWYHSKTIWGALITVGSAAVGSMGVVVDPSTQAELADKIVHLVGAIGGLLAIYGRLSATDTIS